MSENVTTEQHEVQRKLGRCLLRLQQYEGLLKTIAAHQDIHGPLDRLQAIRDGKVQDYANKTLGHMVGVFTGSYLTVEGKAGSSDDADEPEGEVPATGWLRLRTSVSMSPERYGETVQQLKELVALRNDLVHRLIEKFNVWTTEGCVEALSYLEAAYQQIDTHFESLAQWAKGLQEASAASAAFVASKAWEDFFVHGIAPDGAVDWPHSTVVELLREASSADSQDGWTNLAVAIAFIGARQPDQTPKRYGCSSWRQVLHESKLFKIRRENHMDTAPGVTWYRSIEMPCD